MSDDKPVPEHPEPQTNIVLSVMPNGDVKYSGYEDPGVGVMVLRDEHAEPGALRTIVVAVRHDGRRPDMVKAGQSVERATSDAAKGATSNPVLTPEQAKLMTDGACFFPSRTNWMCKLAKAGAWHAVDSAVSVDDTGGRHDFRIDRLTAETSDDGSARALFYIDGVLVASILEPVVDAAKPG